MPLTTLAIRLAGGTGSGKTTVASVFLSQAVLTPQLTYPAKLTDVHHVIR